MQIHKHALRSTPGQHAVDIEQPVNCPHSVVAFIALTDIQNPAYLVSISNPHLPESSEG